jgi:hypothetical protein
VARRGIPDVSLPSCSCDDEKEDLTSSALNSIVGYRRHSKTDWRAFWGGRHSSVEGSRQRYSVGQIVLSVRGR